MSIIYSKESRVRRTLAQLKTHEDWFLVFQLFIVNQNNFPTNQTIFFKIPRN